MNTLFYGDNLDVLRKHIADASVDLVYLDPPFNSNRNYNVLFREKSGKDSASQIEAFTDTWQWDLAAEAAYADLMETAPANVAQMIGALRQFIGSNEMMAYLVMMALRLVELRRVLKPTGSLYLHCDPTASHYLKIVLDTIFGPEQFRNELVWKRADAHNDAKRQFPDLSDRLLFYSRTPNAAFNPQHGGYADRTLRDWYQYLEFSNGTIRRMTKTERETQVIPQGARRFNTGDLRSPNPRPNLMYEYKGYKPHHNGWAVSQERMASLESQGRLIFPKKSDGRIMYKRYLDEQPGAVIGDVWTDVSQLRGADSERLGFPTQKPLGLLERIINASSNPGDVVLDPFCGCGTAVVAAQKLGREWIGIDVTHLAIALIRERLDSSFPGIEYKVAGEPADVGAARIMAEQDRYQFQWWALSLIRARPVDDKQKKGADKGIDGVILFIDDHTHKPKRCLVQVKSGHSTSAHVRDLRGTVEREQAEMGILITLDTKTKDMQTESAEAGFYSNLWGSFPKIQVVTIEELLSGKKPNVPSAQQTYQAAPVIRNQSPASEQIGMEIDG